MGQGQMDITMEDAINDFSREKKKWPDEYEA